MHGCPSEMVARFVQPEHEQQEGTTYHPSLPYLLSHSITEVAELRDGYAFINCSELEERRSRPGQLCAGTATSCAP